MLLIRNILILPLLLSLCHPLYADEKVLLLIYKERESSGGSFISRMIVNKDFMRLDYGPTQKDFVLFDRQSRDIYSVTVSSRTVMVINPKKVFGKPPIEITSTSEQVSKDDIKIYNSEKMLHMRFFANNDRCLDSFIVPDLIPSATKALKSYYGVLAGEHAETIDMIPSELVNACDLSLNIFSPARRFNSGFPIREMIFNGKERILLDYDENHMIDDSWRKIPDGLKRFSPSQMRGDGMGTKKDTSKKYVTK